MSNLIPFNFHGAAVRVIDQGGDPWFVARDVAEVLGYAKPENAIRAHCKGGASCPLETGGQVRHVTIIPERDVYRLVMRSRLPQAEAFEEWVVGEVLPSIRKTGQYRAPNSSPGVDTNVAALLRIGDAVKGVEGVKPGIAMAATLDTISANTGLNVEPMRKALPPAEEPVASLNPRAIGKEVGLSAQKVNSRLKEMGMQTKNDRGEWVLTDAGKEHGEALPFSRNGHAGYQVLWRPSVLGLFSEDAAA